jgi:hypothetical protein
MVVSLQYTGEILFCVGGVYQNPGKGIGEVSENLCEEK